VAEDRRRVFGGGPPRCVFGDANAMTTGTWKRSDLSQSLWSVSCPSPSRQGPPPLTLVPHFLISSNTVSSDPFYTLSEVLKVLKLGPAFSSAQTQFRVIPSHTLLMALPLVLIGTTTDIFICCAAHHLSDRPIAPF